MSFLTDLAKKAKERASQAYDQANPLDNGLSWQTRQVNPNAPKKSVGQQVVGAPVVQQAVVQPAKRAGRTVQSGTAGVAGLSRIGFESMFGTDQSYLDAIKRTQAAVDAPLRRGAYLTPEQSKSRGGGIDSFKKDFVQPVSQGVADIAPLAIPFIKPAEGATLAIKAGSSALQNAAVGGGADALNQFAKKGKVDVKEMAKSAAIGGVIGGAIPVAGPALNKTSEGIDAFAKTKPGQVLKQVNDAVPVGLATKKVGNDGETLYHGGDHSISQFDVNKAHAGGLYGKALYFTKNAERAKSYGSNINEVTLPKNAKLISSSEFEKRVNSVSPNVPYGDPTIARAKVVDQLKKEGFHGVREVNKQNGDTVAIFNPEKLIHQSAQAPKNPQVVMNRLTKGGKDGRQNLSPEVQAGINMDHAVRNTQALQDRAVTRANNQSLNKSIQQAHESLAVKLGHIDDDVVANVQQAIERADAKGRTQDAIALHDALSEHLTKKGQTIQAASLLYRLSPQGLFYKARNDLKKSGANVTPEMEGKLKSMADAIKNAPDDVARDDARAIFHKFVADQRPKGAANSVLSVWKAGLLSGAKTQGGNALSNGTFGVLKTASNPLATGIDRLFALGTGQRTKTLTSRGIVSGTDEGVRSGIKTLKTGIDARNIEGNKYELHGELNFKNPIIQKVFGDTTNLVFRSMSAGDQPFYYAALKNNLYDLAKADGLNKGLRGQELVAHMNKMADAPTTQMAETAKLAAQKAVLGQDNKVATALSGFMQKVPVAQPLAPFIKVPTNFLARTLDYTPVGAVKEAAKQIKAGRFDQRAMSEALSEATTGSAIIYLGAELANHNLLSGQYPTNDPKEAQRWKAEGIQPNSIRIGNTWVSLNYLGPLGMLLGAGKDFNEASQRGDNGTVASIAGLGKNLTGQSFLTGFSGFSNALTDPERSAKKFVNSEAGSVIPSWLNDQANLFDRNQRDTNTPVDQIKSRIPGARNTLPVKQDVYGNPLEQRTDPLNQWLNPLKPSTSNVPNNPVLGEVGRLHLVDKNNNDLQVTPTPVDKALSLGEKDKEGNATKTKINDKQRYDIQKLVGQATQSEWDKFMQTAKYKGMSDTDKANALNKLRQDTTKNVIKQYASDNKLGNPSKMSGASKSSTIDLPQGMNGHDVETLQRFDGLNAQEKAKIIRDEPDAEYKLALAEYERDSKAGVLSRAETIRKQSALKRMEAGKGFSKDVRELYSLNKSQIYSIVSSDPNGKDLAEQLIAYGDALKGTGESSNKLRDSKGNVSIAPKTKGGRKTARGRGGRSSKGSASDLALIKRTNSDAISTVSKLNRLSANSKVKQAKLASKMSLKKPTKAKINNQKVRTA